MDQAVGNVLKFDQALVCVRPELIRWRVRSVIQQGRAYLAVQRTRGCEDPAKLSQTRSYSRGLAPLGTQDKIHPVRYVLIVPCWLVGGFRPSWYASSGHFLFGYVSPGAKERLIWTTKWLHPLVILVLDTEKQSDPETKCLSFATVDLEGDSMRFPTQR